MSDTPQPAPSPGYPPTGAPANPLTQVDPQSFILGMMQTGGGGGGTISGDLPTPSDYFSTGKFGDTPITLTRDPAMATKHLPDGTTIPVPTGVYSGITQKTINDLLAGLYDRQPDEIQNLQEQLYQAGWYGKTASSQIAWGQADDNTFNAWHDFLLHVSTLQNGAGSQKTLDEILQEDITQHQDVLQHGGTNTGGPKSTSSSAVQLTDRETAKGLFRKALESAVGEGKVTDDMLNKFVSALNSQERANPTTVQHNYRYDEAGNAVGESATQSGGFDPGTFAQDYVQQQYGQQANAFKVATDYYQAALQALGPGGGLVSG